VAPPTSIPDVLTVENNIHAGVKVLRHIRDNYFNDPKIDPVNHLLFTFAAYNAGPNRIAELRKKPLHRDWIPTSGSATSNCWLAKAWDR
jgi:membrane-bound lytic murein transglycosylase MltF